MLSKSAGRTLMAALCGTVLLGVPPLSVAEEGYWKRTGAVEFWNTRVPPHGPAKRVTRDWDTTFEVSDGKVVYSNFSKLNPKNPVAIIMQGTWQQPPQTIVPGEVIPVRGRASVVEAEDRGIGGGDPWVQCHIVTKSMRNGQPAGGPLVNLFDGPNRGSARGMAGAYKDYVNTTACFGRKGANFANLREIYVLFQVGHSQANSEAVAAAYRYSWVAASAAGRK
jgi:hypothetical protein